MGRMLIPAVLLISLALVPSGEIRAQTPEQQRAIEKYLRNEDSAGSEAEKPNVSGMYEVKDPELPPDSGEKAQSAVHRSKRFGLDMFAHPPNDFVVSTEIPVPPGYTLGPGDHLIVNLWGHVDLSTELVVDREGKVFIPKAGELVVWGLTLAESEKRIRNLLETIYSDFKMNVVLGKIRSITVYVGGEAIRPGAYTVSSLYTMLNTLYLAGGATERGSLRSIRLLRNGKTVKEMDLYGFFMGKSEQDVKLESNDVIFIPVVGSLVSVEGEVRRPGIYEVLDSDRLMEAIELAGGVRSSAYLGSIEVRRFEDNDRRVLLDLDISSPEMRDRNNIPLIDGDVVKIRALHKITEEVVFLEGAVRYPGEYEFFDGMRISDLVDHDQMLPHTYLKKAFLTRTLFDNTKRVFAVDLGTVLESRKIDVRLGGIPAGPDTGLVTEDIMLQPRDRLTVFDVERIMDEEFVYIDGEVRLPGKYSFADNMTVSDLIFLAGGVKRNAFLMEADLARLSENNRAVSEVEIVNLNVILAGPHGEGDIRLEPGDALFVRETPRYKDHEKVWIGGEVLFPGTYVIEGEGETLLGLLERAGGFTDEAFLEGAIMQRRGILEELEHRHVEEVISALQRSYVDSIESRQLKILPMELNSEKMSRIVIDLPCMVKGDYSGSDIDLQDGDRILIPRLPSGINVIGAVASSGTIKHLPGKNANYYIQRAGGLTRGAEKGEIRILKANGRVVKKGALSHRIELGDAIVIPERVVRDRNWLQAIQSSVSIIAGALTAVLIATKL